MRRDGAVRSDSRTVGAKWRSLYLPSWLLQRGWILDQPRRDLLWVRFGFASQSAKNTLLFQSVIIVRTSNTKNEHKAHTHTHTRCCSLSDAGWSQLESGSFHIYCSWISYLLESRLNVWHCAHGTAEINFIAYSILSDDCELQQTQLG